MGAQIDLQDPKEERYNKVGMVQDLSWYNCKGEGIGCTLAQTKPL